MCEERGKQPDIAAKIDKSMHSFGIDCFVVTLAGENSVSRAERFQIATSIAHAAAGQSSIDRENFQQAMKKSSQSQPANKPMKCRHAVQILNQSHGGDVKRSERRINAYKLCDRRFRQLNGKIFSSLAYCCRIDIANPANGEPAV